MIDCQTKIAFLLLLTLHFIKYESLYLHPSPNVILGLGLWRWIACGPHSSALSLVILPNSPCTIYQMSYERFMSLWNTILSPKPFNAILEAKKSLYISLVVCWKNESFMLGLHREIETQSGRIQAFVSYLLALLKRLRGPRLPDWFLCGR